MTYPQPQGFLAVPPTGKGNGVLVLHAWWGLNQFFKEVCDHLAEQGFIVLAPDLRDGKVAKTIEEATELMKNNDVEFSGQVVEAGRGYLMAHPSRSGKKLGGVGFSMGANWALTMASSAPDSFGAVVAFYGTSDADFSKMKAKFQGHFCEQDEWEPIKYVQGMEAEMKSAGVEADFQIYRHTSHWFMETDRPEYDRESASLAWERTVDLFKRRLGT